MIHYEIAGDGILRRITKRINRAIIATTAINYRVCIADKGLVFAEQRYYNTNRKYKEEYYRAPFISFLVDI